MMVEAKTEMELLCDTIVAMARECTSLRAERDEALDKLKYARESIANIEAERDEARRKRKQANGHNDLLRDQNVQLQAALKEARADLSTQMRQDLLETIIADKGVGPTRPAWDRNIVENVRKQIIADSAEPELAAALVEGDHPMYYCRRCQRFQPHRPMIDTPEFHCVECHNIHIDHRRFEEAQKERAAAKAVAEGEMELERAAQGEPTTEECPECGGQGYCPAGTTANKVCPVCHGTGIVVVKAESDNGPTRAQRIRASALREADKEYCEVVEDAKRTRDRAVTRVEADYKERMAQEPRETPPVEPEGDEPAVATDEAF